MYGMGWFGDCICGDSIWVGCWSCDWTTLGDWLWIGRPCRWDWWWLWVLWWIFGWPTWLCWWWLWSWLFCRFMLCRLWLLYWCIWPLVPWLEFEGVSGELDLWDPFLGDWDFECEGDSFDAAMLAPFMLLASCKPEYFWLGRNVAASPRNLPFVVVMDVDMRLVMIWLMLWDGINH